MLCASMHIHAFVHLLINSKGIINAIGEYLGKLNFNIFINITYSYLYCHSVQTHYLKLFFFAVRATKPLWCIK
jgi:hypothetical protein